MLPISQYLTPDALAAAGFVPSGHAGRRNAQTWVKGAVWVDMEGVFARGAEGERGDLTNTVTSYYLNGAPWAGGQMVLRLGDMGAGASSYAPASFDVPDLGAVVSKADAERINNQLRGSRGFVTDTLNAGGGLGAVILVATAGFAAIASAAVGAAATAAASSESAAVVGAGEFVGGASGAAVAGEGALIGGGAGATTVGATGGALVTAAGGVVPAWAIPSAPVLVGASGAALPFLGVAQAGAGGLSSALPVLQIPSLPGGVTPGQVATAVKTVAGIAGGAGAAATVGGSSDGLNQSGQGPAPTMTNEYLWAGAGILLAVGLIYWALK